MNHQYQAAIQYANQKGFALRNYFLTCIKRGDWESISVELENKTNVTEMQNALGSDARFALFALILPWSQMQHSAVAGGLSEEEASSIFIHYVDLAQKASTVDHLFSLNVKIIHDFAVAVENQHKRVGKMAPIISCQRYIQDHIFERLTPRKLAEEMHFSVDHLSRIFKRYAGVTITEYIHQQRIEEAKNLLLYSSLSIADISGNLCFCTQSYFTNIFKRIVGVTPRQFRNMNREF